MPRPESEPQKTHYSEKGGHLFRGQEVRRQRIFASQFPNIPYFPPALHPEGQFLNRRFMMRDPVSGKASTPIKSGSRR